MDCKMSSGSKPETTMGFFSLAAIHSVGAAADHGRDVARTNESIEAHVRRIENGADGGDDRDVIAEDRKVSEAE